MTIDGYLLDGYVGYRALSVDVFARLRQVTGCCRRCSAARSAVRYPPFWSIKRPSLRGLRMTPWSTTSSSVG